MHCVSRAENGSCQQKGALLFAEKLREEILAPVDHGHGVPFPTIDWTVGIGFADRGLPLHDPDRPPPALPPGAEAPRPPHPLSLRDGQALLPSGARPEGRRSGHGGGDPELPKSGPVKPPRHRVVSAGLLLPGGEMYKDLTMDDSADLEWSTSFSIEEGVKKYHGSWTYKIKATNAEGVYNLSITTY